MIPSNKTIVFKLAEFPHLSETFILAQIIAAKKLGYSVQVLTGKFLHLNDAFYQKTLEEYKISKVIHEENYQIPTQKVKKVFSFLWIFVSNFLKLPSIIAFYQLKQSFSLTWLFQWRFYQKWNDSNTIFHIQYGTNRNPIDILKASGFFKPKVVMTFHGHDAFFPINGFIQNNGYYKNAFQFFETITANTPYLAEKMIEIGCPSNRLQIVPVGVDVHFFTPKKSTKKTTEVFKIITVGRLDPVKGHQYGIEIIKKLIDSGYQVHFTIVGDGAEKENLTNLINQLQLQEHVQMVGKKSATEIVELNQMHDLYLFTGVPLPDGRRETQGLATLEAQACGLPVVAFDSGGVKYTLINNETGFLVPEFGTDESVKKIITLIKNEMLQKEFSLKARQFVESKYAQSIINQQWELIYAC